MMDFYKELGPCPRCGGNPIIYAYNLGCHGYSATIKCEKCGLTMDYDNESRSVMTVSGRGFTLGHTVSWSYEDNNCKSAIEVWNDGFGGIKNA